MDARHGNRIRVTFRAIWMVREGTSLGLEHHTKGRITIMALNNVRMGFLRTRRGSYGGSVDGGGGRRGGNGVRGVGETGGARLGGTVLFNRLR